MINFWLKRLTQHIDGYLLGIILLTLLVGLFVLFSASDQSVDRVLSQLANIGVALSLMLLFANIPPHHLVRVALPLYGLGLLLLLGVFFFGEISLERQEN